MSAMPQISLMSLASALPWTAQFVAESAVGEQSQYRYHPFYEPAPLAQYSYFLLIPLCIGVAVVYKSVRCKRMSRVPREAIILAAIILAVLFAVQVAMAAVVEISRR